MSSPMGIKICPISRCLRRWESRSARSHDVFADRNQDLSDLTMSSPMGIKICLIQRCFRGTGSGCGRSDNVSAQRNQDELDAAERFPEILHRFVVVPYALQIFGS